MPDTSVVSHESVRDELLDIRGWRGIDREKLLKYAVTLRDLPLMQSEISRSGLPLEDWPATVAEVLECVARSSHFAPDAKDVLVTTLNFGGSLTKLEERRHEVRARLKLLDNEKQYKEYEETVYRKFVDRLLLLQISPCSSGASDDSILRALWEKQRRIDFQYAVLKAGDGDLEVGIEVAGGWLRELLPRAWDALMPNPPQDGQDAVRFIAGILSLILATRYPKTAADVRGLTVDPPSEFLPNDRVVAVFMRFAGRPFTIYDQRLLARQFPDGWQFDAASSDVPARYRTPFSWDSDEVVGGTLDLLASLVFEVERSDDWSRLSAEAASQRPETPRPADDIIDPTRHLP